MLNEWKIDNVSDVFKTLSEAKAYIKSLPLSEVEDLYNSVDGMIYHYINGCNIGSVYFDINTYGSLHFYRGTKEVRPCKCFIHI